MGSPPTNYMRLCDRRACKGYLNVPCYNYESHANTLGLGTSHISESTVNDEGHLALYMLMQILMWSSKRLWFGQTPLTPQAYALMLLTFDCNTCGEINC